MGKTTTNDRQVTPMSVRWANDVEKNGDLPSKPNEETSDVSAMSDTSPTKGERRPINTKKKMLAVRAESASKISASSVKVAFKDSIEKQCGEKRSIFSSLSQFFCVPSSLKSEFSSKSLEEVYQHYYEHQKLDRFLYIILLVFLVNMALIAMYAAVFQEDSQTQINRVIITCVYGVFYLLLISLYLLKLFPARIFKWLPYIIWLGIFSELLVDQTVGYDPLTPSDSVAMFTFFSFINYVMLPARLVICAVFSLVIGIAHIIVSGTQARHNLLHLGQQVSPLY